MIPNFNGPIFLIHDLANFYENEILYQKRPKITMIKKVKPNALILFMFMVKLTFLNNELLQPRSESQTVIYSILSKSCREFNSRHFGPFLVEKYSKLTILKHF